MAVAVCARLFRAKTPPELLRRTRCPSSQSRMPLARRGHRPVLQMQRPSTTAASVAVGGVARIASWRCRRSAFRWRGAARVPVLCERSQGRSQRRATRPQARCVRIPRRLPNVPRWERDSIGRRVYRRPRVDPSRNRTRFVVRRPNAAPRRSCRVICRSGGSANTRCSLTGNRGTFNPEMRGARAAPYVLYETAVTARVGHHNPVRGSSSLEN
jgi:hypothetical protein